MIKKRPSKRTYPGLDNSSAGAVSEMRVCADLMIRGYEVFRAISPSSSCDLLAMKNGRLYRIEVRTARTTQDGTVQIPMDKRDTGRLDYYAGVLKDKIVYFPELNLE